MITPILIHFIFWVGLAGLIIGTIVGAVNADTGGGRTLLIVFLFVGPVCWRIACEVLLIWFQISETLLEIRNIATRNVED
jgi:hypothetical protein